MFSLDHRAYSRYYIDTSVGFLLENIEIVYQDKIMSGYPVISEKEFRSQQQVVLSGFYELSPFKIQFANDADVTYFLKRRECDLFAIAYNRDVSKPSKKYMISSIAIEDELVLRGLALMIYRFTHCYSLEYETWVDCLITN
nr:hypothetical protein [Tanacetum cinerariifolium]